MKKLAVLIFIVFTIAIAATYRQNDETSDEHNEVSVLEHPLMRFSEQDVVTMYNLPLDELESENFFTVYLPSTLDNAQQEVALLNYLNDLVQGAGQPIEFRLFVYSQLRVRALLDGMSSDSVIITTKMDAITLYREGLIGDFYSEAFLHAPTFMEQVRQAITPGSMFHIPTEAVYRPLAPAAFIRNDIYLEWMRDVGLPVTDVYSLEMLLMWQQERDPHNIPAAYITNYPDYWFYRYDFLSLDMWMDGYSSLVGLLLHEANLSTPLWQNDATGEILPFYEIPSAVDAMIMPLLWRDRDLISFWDGNPLRSDFPVIMLNSGYAQYYIGLNNASYRLRIIAPATKSIVRTSDFNGAIALPDADIRPFLNFLEWLTIPQNYRLFRFGVRHADFFVDADNYIIHFVNDDYVFWWSKNFIDSDYMNRMHFRETEETIDLHEVLNAIEVPQFPLDYIIRQSIAVELVENEEYISALYNTARQMGLLHMQIYNDRVTVYEARDLIESAFRRISNIAGIDEAERLIRARQ